MARRRLGTGSFYVGKRRAPQNCTSGKGLGCPRGQAAACSRTLPPPPREPPPPQLLPGSVVHHTVQSLPTPPCLQTPRAASCHLHTGEQGIQVRSRSTRWAHSGAEDAEFTVSRRNKAAETTEPWLPGSVSIDFLLLLQAGRKCGHQYPLGMKPTP